MTDAPARTHAPLLDLQGLLAGVRRHRRIWASMGVLGFVTGALFVVLFPAPPAAVTRVLVVHEDGQGGSEAIKSDLALLETTRIAADAVERLGTDERPSVFLSSFDAQSVANDVLEITVSGPSTQDAIARAQALADAFIADHIRRAEALADAEAEALLERQADTERELADVDREIAAGGAPSDALAATRASLAARVSDLGEQAEDARIGAPRAAAGTQVVDPPHVVTGSVPEGAEFAVVGLVLGLGGGLALAAVLTVVRDRPVLRRDIAEHLGASIIAQLPAPRHGLARLRRPSRATERGRLAATLARLVHGSPGAVSVLELGCARAAAEIALGVAGELSRKRPVVVVDGLPGRQVHKSGGKPDEAVRVIDDDEAAAEPSPGRRPGHLLGVGTVGPGTAWTDLPWLGRETLLVVRAGHANTSWLHTVARQLADADITVLGIVLVRPDPRDRSDGTLWDGLHIALRGRVGLPTTFSAENAGDGRNGLSSPVESTADKHPAVDRLPTDKLPAALLAPADHVENP